MNLLKHLTHIEGTTTADLVAATGLPIERIRAELAALEKEGKAVRERGKIGHPHLWWRIERKPLGDREVVLCMGLAAAIHKHAGTLRSVLGRLSTRAADPKLRYVLGLAQTSRNPHAVVAGTLQLS